MNVIIGISLATIFRMLLGMAWYSQGAFGPAWIKSIKISAKDIKQKDAQIALLGGLITSIIISAMLSCLVTRLAIQSVVSGFLLGLSVWFGFVATNGIGGILWEKKSLQWFVITTGYECVAYALSGIIIT